MAWPTSDFPTGLDAPTDRSNNVDNIMADDINGVYDCIEKIEAKIGINSSAVTSSLDYLLKSASSSNPGHRHTLANGATDVTASAAEVNLIDGSVAGTAVASKVLALGANKNVDTLVVADGGLKLGSGAGTAITATAAELNLIDGSVAGTNVASKALVVNASRALDVLTITGAFAAGATTITGALTATGNITAYYSDDRLKTKTGKIKNALQKVLSLNGFHYHANRLAKKLGYKSVPEVGVSAQEVQKVLPEAVAPAPIDPQYLTVQYERLIPLLIEAIKELSAKVDKLEGKK